MWDKYQKTLNSQVSFSGIGLHSGKKVDVTLEPTNSNSGITFKRIDLEKNNEVIANFKNVSSAKLCTKIENEFGTTVSTVEHLMAAFYICGIDNLVVNLNGPEVPIMDGSAKNFVENFLDIGFELSDSPIKLIKIINKVTLEDGSKYISIDKSNVSLDIDFEIKYSNSLIGNQKNKINVYENKLSDIYNSRTFCLYEDIENLRKMGLAKGGSLNNAVVVKDNEVLNPEGLRNNFEFVNHKILDCMGDLYLSGYKIIGSLKCSQGGHSLTNRLLRKVFSDKNNYTIFEIKEKSLPHTYIDKSILKSIA